MGHGQAQPLLFDQGEGKPGLRVRGSRLASRLGLLPLLTAVRQRLRSEIRILAYHRVLDSALPEGFQFDPGLISASREGFVRQVALVKRRFHPITFARLLDHLDAGTPLPPRALLISFDDGYEDNYRIARPILKAHGLSAMFFVCTGHIDSGRPYEYDWLHRMLCASTARECVIPEIDLRLPMPVSLEDRRGLAWTVLDRLKHLDANAQSVAIRRLQTRWNMTAADDGQRQPMTWAQLRQMRADGMEIGSHGVHHRMLSKLPRDEMVEELRESKRALDRELDQDTIALSYPVGGPDAFDETVMHAAREAGYGLACSYTIGTVPRPVPQRYAMERLSIERQMDPDWFNAFVSWPEIFGFPTRVRTA